MRTRKIFEAAYGESQHPPIFEARVKDGRMEIDCSYFQPDARGVLREGDVVQVQVHVIAATAAVGAECWTGDRYRK